MAQTTWKGYLSFGLISAPVKIFAAARSESVSFNQLHAKCKQRINQEKICKHCNETVAAADLLKGFEYEKGQFLVFTEEEVSANAPGSSKILQVDRFVNLTEVDPIFFDASYYLVPDGEPGKKVYSLLSDTMRSNGKAAIVKICMRNREYMAIIRPYRRGLTLHTLFYEDEVREVPEFSGMDTVEVTAPEKAMAGQLLESLTQPFDPAAYHDGFRAAVNAMIEAKRAGATFTPATPPKSPAAVVDLMAALSGSLNMAKEKAGAAPTPAVTPVAEPTPVKAPKPAPKLSSKKAKAS